MSWRSERKSCLSAGELVAVLQAEQAAVERLAAAELVVAETGYAEVAAVAAVESQQAVIAELYTAAGAVVREAAAAAAEVAVGHKQ
jgi:hypothetical protein